ncbi:hypothetical protein T492DRAFT_874230 [Pavlovales sp. CCMP2436]|nr:hypothetical protein T492DRAFT_874230 [Pavlovales sp. CCMP2436]
MDLRNLEMEEYCPPPDLLDLLEKLKIPHHLDKLKELCYDDVDDFENVDITRFETACTGGGIPPAHIDKLIRATRKRRLCQPLTMPPLPLGLEGSVAATMVARAGLKTAILGGGMRVAPIGGGTTFMQSIGCLWVAVGITVTLQAYGAPPFVAVFISWPLYAMWVYISIPASVMVTNVMFMCVDLFFKDVTTRNTYKVPTKSPVLFVCAPHSNQLLDPLINR